MDIAKQVISEKVNCSIVLVYGKAPNGAKEKKIDFKKKENIKLTEDNKNIFLYFPKFKINNSVRSSPAIPLQVLCNI